MRRICALTLILILVAAIFTGCGSKEATWADYQTWLIETFASTSPDSDGFKTLVESIGSWDELDTGVEPWNKIFGEEFFNASTWEQFRSTGSGSYNSGFVDDYESSGEPVGAASGEPTAEPAA